MSRAVVQMLAIGVALGLLFWLIRRAWDTDAHGLLLAFVVAAVWLLGHAIRLLRSVPRRRVGPMPCSLQHDDIH